MRAPVAQPLPLTFYVLLLTFHVLPRRSPTEAGSRFTFHVSRLTHQPIVTAELHHSCTVSSPIFENAFHYSLSPNHLQNPIRKMVQFLACRADLPRRSIRAKAGALGEDGLTFTHNVLCRRQIRDLVPPSCRTVEKRGRERHPPRTNPAPTG